MGGRQQGEEEEGWQGAHRARRGLGPPTPKCTQGQVCTSPTPHPSGSEALSFSVIMMACWQLCWLLDLES